MISLLQSYRVSLSANAQFHREHPRWQVYILFACFLMSLFSYVLLSIVAQPLGKPIGPFMLLWGVCFLPYFLSCFWIMSTRPVSGRWHWGELGIIFVGAIIFRIMLLHLPLGLSRDAWRYLWDARVLLHGYSPYQYVPFDKVLIPLRDTVFAETPYRSALTPYPPVAELFFILGYFLNPTHLIGLKSLFVAMDIVTCAAIMLLLSRKGCDPRFAIIYAWSPLPILEAAHTVPACMYGNDSRRVRSFFIFEQWIYSERKFPHRSLRSTSGTLRNITELALWLRQHPSSQRPNSYSTSTCY